MSNSYRLSDPDLFEVLADWDANLPGPMLLVACGGTALTLLGHKESTKDVDFLIPVPSEHDALLKLFKKLGYRQATGAGYLHPNGNWIFDIYRGQTIFQTELLDPVHLEGNHRVIKKYTRLTLSCLNPPDLIISKMFRGTQVDVQDSVTVLKSESIDLAQLGRRYRETAEYYFDPGSCKKNLSYLIAEMDREDMDSSALKEMHDKWTP